MVSHHGIDPNQEPSHAGDDGDFFWFARFEQALVKVLKNGVESCSDNGGHVQDASHVRSSSPNAALPFSCSAVAAHGRHPQQRTNLFAAQRSEFRHKSGEVHGYDGTHASAVDLNLGRLSAI